MTTFAPPTHDLGEQIAELRTSIAALEKQISRAGREQLKANALTTTQSEQAAAALEQLRTAATQRDAEIAALRERTRGEIAEARLSVVKSILPALDGLDEAIRSGHAALARHTANRLLSDLLELPADPALSAMQQTLSAWLHGLEFVRRRLLDTLAAEGVTPIPATGTPFNPQLHLALEAVAAPKAAPGTIVHEIRRGYLVGERVLRHAEVAVART